MAARIFVPYDQYYDYLEHEQWKIYKDKIYYSGSTGVIYTGINSNGVVDNNDIVSYMVGTGSNTPGNAYTSTFDGEVLLGIPYYYGETTKSVTRIGLNAFMNNTSIQRVTISSSITHINSYAFKGCSSLKYVILEGSQPPSIGTDVFADNPADRIFIVPDGSRDIYIKEPSWVKFEAYIIEWSAYQQMITGSGFTHFIINCSSETTIGLNIYKFDTSTMTIIWGDGATDIISGSFISDSKALRHTYLADADDYTISIIARGKWIFSNSTTIFNGQAADMCLKEAYFDDFYCAYRDNANYLEGTYANNALFTNTSNLTRLQLSNNAISMPSGFLSRCTKLEFLKIPFPGTKQNTTGEAGLLGALFYGMQSTTTSKEITQIYGTDGNDTTYTVRVPMNLKVLDVSGTGTIMTGAFSGFDMIEKIILNSNTIKLEDYTFYKCSNLSDIDMPTKITSIGKSCFENCVKLKIESLPSSLTTIGERSFYGCELANFSLLPEGITSIPSYVFYNCYNITLSSLPSGLTSIGEYAFCDCQRITISSLPSGITDLSKGAFSGCKNITLSEIPSEMTTIPDDLFKGCEKVLFSSLPSGLTSIGEYAFYNCKNITISTIPIAVTEIKTHAFSGCALISIASLPDNTTTIGSYAFEGCKNIVVTSLPPNITSLTEGVFKDCPSIIFSYLPESITEIPKEAFSGCNSIIITNLPSNLISVGESAFNNCTSMKLTSLPSKLEKIETNAFYNCVLISISRIPSSVKSIGSKAFYNCQNISDIIDIGNIMNKTSALLSDGTLNIYPDAFSWGNSAYGNMVDTLNIYKSLNDSCTKLPNGSAYSQNAFTSVTISQFINIQSPTPNLFTYEEIISGDVTGYRITGFASNGTDESYIPDTYDGKPVIAIGDNAFNCDNNNYNNRSIYISDTSQIEIIGINAFRNNRQSYDLVLPPSLKTIGEGAFYGCTSIKINELPSSLEQIGDNAFYNCQNINLNTMPYSIKNIADGAFDKCTGITELDLKTCTEIESLDIHNYEPDTSTDDGNGKMLIHKISMPVNNSYIKNFITTNIRYTMVVRFRASNVKTFDILNLSHGYEQSELMTSGYKIYVLNGTLYVGNYSIYDNIKINVTYTLVIRCSPTDETIRNSVLLATDDPDYFDVNNMDKYEGTEFNRFNFGYTHPVVGATTYGLYNFNFGDNSNKGIISSIDYWMGDYSNGTDVYVNDGYLTDIGINKLYNISTFSIPASNKYVQSNLGSLMSSLSWSEIMAIGREGYMYCENPTTYPYKSEWHIDIDRSAKEGTVGNVSTEAWFVLGEQRGMNLTYPEGAKYSNCEDIKLELVGFTSDISDHYGVCPLTFGLVDLLPEKQQLYSAAHFMRDCVVTTRYNPTIYRDANGMIDANLTNVENIVSTNATSFALPAIEDTAYTDGDYHETQKYVWIVANLYTAISKIYVNKNGSLVSGINFNSTETNKYANFPKNEIVDGVIIHNGEYFGTIDSWSGHLFNTATGTVDESTSCFTIILDATFGKIIRDENCECILLYPGAKLGIPVGGENDGNQVYITYYSSYNLTGWRDCIIRDECNNYHYKALDLSVRNMVERVLKRTNVGGLHKSINETKDLLWLYSLSEAGMYNATDPYMYEGEAYQYYQPSVAGNGGRTAVRKKILFNDSTKNFQYWWLRTPTIIKRDNNFGSVICNMLTTGLGSEYYYLCNREDGVCFGFSTKSNDRPRLYNADMHLESMTYLPISAASALSPQNGITHIYTFEIDNLDKTDALVDMCYPNAVGDTTYSHGYTLSISSDGIWLNSKHILTNTEVFVGNKVTLIIRQNSVVSEALSSEILVFVNNDYVKKFTDNDGFGNNMRTYSTSSRQPIINANVNRRFENVSIFAKELTDDELKDLFVCRLLNFENALE